MVTAESLLMIAQAWELMIHIVISRSLKTLDSTPRTKAKHESCKSIFYHNNCLLFRYIGNLDPNVTEDFLFAIFSQVGQVTKIKAVKDVSFAVFILWLIL
jgi:RNA recognition motif-containing protein